MARDALDTVIKGDLCTGCGLCQSIAGHDRVTVSIDDRSGQLRPLKRKPLDRATSKKIAASCPGLDVSHSSVGPNFDPVWGPIESVSFGASSEQKVRTNASSGGVLSAIQLYLLEHRLVDYVLSTAASTNDPFNTETVSCVSRHDVLNSAGSRYAPSAPLQNINTHLDNPGIFAFVGKPCDVAALRRLGQIDPRVSKKIPYMLSFMCAGVPSREGTLNIVREMGLLPSEVIKFRYRGDGWPGFAKAETRSGGVKLMTYEESWQRILSPKIQWRCKFCPDGTGEHADITGADAWHINSDRTPDFSEHDGRSFIIARTQVGTELLDATMRNGYLTGLERTSIDNLNVTQFHQAYRKKTSLVRNLALGINFMPAPRYNLTILLRASLMTSPVALTRSFFGAVKRIMAKSSP